MEGNPALISASNWKAIRHAAQETAGFLAIGTPHDKDDVGFLIRSDDHAVRERVFGSLLSGGSDIFR